MLTVFAALLLVAAPAAAQCADGAHELRSADGIVLESGACRGGVRVGEWIFRFDDGSLASRGIYEDGVEHGRWIERSPSGESEEGEYFLGERVGTWRIRSAEGEEAALEYGGGDVDVETVSSR